MGAAANAGDTVTFTCAATGAPDPDYAWYYSDDGGTTWHDSLVSSAALSFEMSTAYDGFQYYCKVSSTAGSVDSDIVTLNVAVAPSITTQPVDTTAWEGVAATFTAAATGVPDPDYQWQVSADGSTWDDVTTGMGGETASYTTAALTDATDGYQYRCVVSNIAGSANSDAATLTVKQLKLSSSVSDGTIYVGGCIVLTPNFDGGTWDWDEEYFSAKLNSPATFTALKAGTSTITYTAGGVITSYDVTIEEAQLPATGQDFTWVWLLRGAALILGAAAGVLVRRRRKSVNNKQ